MKLAFSAWGALRSAWGAFRTAAVAGVYLGFAAFVLMDQWFFRFEYYFELGRTIVPASVSPSGFKMDISSHPKRVFDGSYKVLLRDAISGQVLKEYPDSGVFEYKPKDSKQDAGPESDNQGAGPESGRGEAGPAPLRDPVGFDWWVGLKGKLPPLPLGLVYAQTCWTVHSRPFPLGNVTDCVESNQFRVVAEE